MPPAVKKAKSAPVGPAVVYPKLKCTIFEGEKALTVEQAKELLGWEAETDTVKFGQDYLFIDVEGNKVRTTHNLKNRPFGLTWAKTLAQEHLKKNWHGLNGENMTIDKYGDVQSGQHRLISLVLAEQMRKKSPDVWDEYWDTEVTMECSIMFGIEADDKTVNTIDTGRPRSLDDVLYRSAYFADKPTQTRKLFSRATEFCIRELWERTGANKSPLSTYATHAELIDFLERHKSILKCVETVMNNSPEKLQRHIGLGYLSAMMYLMATSTDSRENYEAVSPPNESVLGFEQWDQAQAFVEEFGTAADISPLDHDFKPLLVAIARLKDVDGEGSGSVAEKMALITKAWYLYSEEKPITEPRLKLKYDKTPDEVSVLAEWPTFGGIDLDPEAEEKLKDQRGGHVTVASVEAEKERVKAEKEAAEQPKPKGVVPKPKPTDTDDMGFPLDYSAIEMPEETGNPFNKTKTAAALLSDEDLKVLEARRNRAAKK